MTCIRGARGFTLVETVVALFILSVAVVFATIVVGTTKVVRDAALESSAFRIADNKLNELRAVGYAALPASGPFTDPELANLPNGLAGTSVSTVNAETKKIETSVSWTGADGSPRSVSLTTLVTEVGGL